VARGKLIRVEILAQDAHRPDHPTGIRPALETEGTKPLPSFGTAVEPQQVAGHAQTLVTGLEEDLSGKGCPLPSSRHPDSTPDTLVLATPL